MSGQMNICVSDDFKRLLRKGARDLRISMAQLVEDAVRDYLVLQGEVKVTRERLRCHLHGARTVTGTAMAGFRSMRVRTSS